MKSYELNDHQEVLKARLSIDDDGRPAWDFSMDEWGGQWLSEADRADIIQAIEFFERHSHHQSAFRTEGFTIRRSSRS